MYTSNMCKCLCALCCYVRWTLMCGYENNRRLYFATMLKVEGSSNCQRRIQWESSSNSYWLCGKRHVQKARHLIRKKRKWTFPLRRTAIILVSFLFVKNQLENQSEWTWLTEVNYGSGIVCVYLFAFVFFSVNVRYFINFCVRIQYFFSFNFHFDSV